jgi:ferredoxin
MALVITEKCVGTCDTACVEVCPCDCIWGPLPLEEVRAVPPEERRARFGSMQLYIDPTVCIDCFACQPVCPAEAIYHENDVPEAHRPSIAANARFFEERG